MCICRVFDLSHRARINSLYREIGDTLSTVYNHKPVSTVEADAARALVILGLTVHVSRYSCTAERLIEKSPAVYLSACSLQLSLPDAVSYSGIYGTSYHDPLTGVQSRCFVSAAGTRCILAELVGYISTVHTKRKFLPYPLL